MRPDRRGQGGSKLPHSKVAHCPARRGFSLLEVLVSIFVILFALLSLAALLTVGKGELVMATNADRSVACGLEGLTELQVPRHPYAATTGSSALSCSFCQPMAWRDAINFSSVVQSGLFDGSQGYAIDPLYCAYCANAPSGSPTFAQFPYPDPENNPAPIWMRRVTLAPADVTSVGIQQTYFDRIFTSHDDLVFAQQAPNPPPAGVPQPALDQLRPQRIGIGGVYSWMATVVPVPTLGDSSSSSYAVSTLRSYQCSVVVFNNRDYSVPWNGEPPDNQPPAERCVVAVVPPATTTTVLGEVTLYAPNVNNLNKANYLNVRENDWIMLCAQEQPSGFAYAHKVFQWYRVVAASQIERRDCLGPVQRVTAATCDAFGPRLETHVVLAHVRTVSGRAVHRGNRCLPDHSESVRRTLPRRRTFRHRAGCERAV